MTAADERTVGQAVADSIAEPLAALATFDAAARALANGIDGAAEEYAASLELAEALDAWDAERRVQIALEALDAETDKTHRDCPVSSWNAAGQSALPEDRRVSELYAAHVGELIAAGVMEPSEAIGLSQLGLLRPREAGKRVGELSMGQQRRLDLALVLATRPHVLLLDEPTNHLSIALVDELTEALGATQAAVVLSTHDRQLLRDVEDWPSLQLTASVDREALV
jgi:macrolide transport system ATP-binding/permease protein